MIYWAYPAYHLGQYLFPGWLFNWLHLNRGWPKGWRFISSSCGCLWYNGVLYVAYTLCSGEWRMLVPRSTISVPGCLVRLLHDLHLRREVPAQEKYNAAQQIVYHGIVVMGLGSLMTGLAIYKPTQLDWLSSLAAAMSVPATSIIPHHWLFRVFSRLYYSGGAVTGWDNFRSMVIGYELVKQND